MSKEIPTPAHANDHQLAGARVIRQREGGLILIGDTVQAVILGASDGVARIAIRAPRHLEITAPKQ